MTGKWEWRITSTNGTVIMRMGKGFYDSEEALRAGISELRSYFRDNPFTDGVSLTIENGEA